jgi:hypothetical protein
MDKWDKYKFTSYIKMYDYSLYENGMLYIVFNNSSNKDIPLILDYVENLEEKKSLLNKFFERIKK